VNSSDDNGILTGRWDGEYSDGVSPTKWTGSVAILQKYMETKQPVSIGVIIIFLVEAIQFILTRTINSST